MFHCFLDVQTIFFFSKIPTLIEANENEDRHVARVPSIERQFFIALSKLYSRVTRWSYQMPI